MHRSFQIALASLALILGLAAQPALAVTPREACQTDVKTYCNNLTPGRGAIVKCLRDHEAQLTPTCKESFQNARMRHPRMTACHEDVQKLCPGLQPGGGAIRDCLKEHESELSDACKDERAKMATMRKGRAGIMMEKK